MASSLTTSTARDCVPGSMRSRQAARPRRHRSFAVGVTLLLLAVFAAGCDWLQPGFDGGHSNFNPFETLTAATVGSLTKQFSTPFQGTILSGTLVIGGEIAYSYKDASGNVAVTTVDAATGAPGWTTTLPGLAADATGVVSDGANIYIAGQEADGSSHVIAVSAASGAIVWDVTLPPGGAVGKPLGWPPTPAPVVAGGRLFLARHAVPISCCSVNVTYMALDTATGNALWTYTTQDSSSPLDSITGTLAVTNDSVAIVTDNVTTTLNAADGSVKWSSSAPPAPFVPEALTAGRSGVLFGPYGAVDLLDHSQAQLAAVDANTGAIKWLSPAGLGFGLQAITDNQVIVADSNNNLEALDINTGLVQWQMSLPAGTTSDSGAVVARGLIYTVTSDGTTNTLRTYDVATGAPVSATAVSSYGFPLVAEGHVYIVNGTSIDAYAPAS